MHTIRIVNGVPRHPDFRFPEPINLEIGADEHVAIVGPNASGKSRLVDIIRGRYPLLSTGRIGYDFTPSPLKLVSENIKYISFRDSYGDADSSYYYQQRWNQHDIDPATPTVGELLDRSFAASGGSEEVRRHLHEMFGLDALRDNYVISLSSGELRKFQLTRALYGKPRILILEAPFIGLDAQTRDALSQLLEKLSKEMQIILVVATGDYVPKFINRTISTTPPQPSPQGEGDLSSPLLSANLPSADTNSSLANTNSSIANTNLSTANINSSIANTNLSTANINSSLANTNLSTANINSSLANTNNNTPSPCGEGWGGVALSFNHVTIRYNSRTILNDLSWTVRKGENWALMGQNGSGKSTLLSLVCADNPQAYACDISLFGRKRGSGESIWEIKKHIGYVSPEMHRAYMRDLPAIDIVASGLHDSVGLYVRPKPEQRQQCLDWMRRFGIEELADRTFLKLSSGEQRLVLVCRAFVKNPDLLILDEPLHGLDADNRAMVRRIIHDYCASPDVTLIMVTHYPEELPDNITNTLTLTR